MLKTGILNHAQNISKFFMCLLKYCFVPLRKRRSERQVGARSRHLDIIEPSSSFQASPEALESLHGAQYFSSIDLHLGYRQLGVDENDREKTTFITPNALYPFKVMPFGLCDAPATF